MVSVLIMNTYIVALNEGVDYDAFWNEIENLSPTDGFVPSRRVDIVNNRDAFKRICEYSLTEEEAEQLMNDPRIAAVERPVRDLPYVKIVHNTILDKNFDKTTSSTGDNVNWGLIRHSNVTNVYGTGTDDANNNYTYDLDGTGVDVVINDTGIQTGHPEFGARLKSLNWTSYYSGYELGTNQNDTDGHGTHVAGIVAGNTYGWAEGADIYSLSTNSNPTGQSEADPLDFFEALINWHNAKTNNRPTVVNMSWGMITNLTPPYNTGTNYHAFISGGQYRGTPILSGQPTSYYTSKGGISLTGNGIPLQGPQSAGLPYSSVVYNNALGEVIDAGIIAVQAAGNHSFKIDVPGGADYNNYVTFSGTPGNFYYHRGTSPIHPKSIVVGALGAFDNLNGDRQAEYTAKGPRIDIYAAGTWIMSACSNINNFNGQSYQHGNASYKQVNIFGTSMASPQVAGIIALRLQQSPLGNIKASTNCETIKSWLTNNALINQIYSPTTSTTDYTNSVALLGAPNRIAYINPLSPTYSYIKDDTNTWRKARAIYAKHDDNTWKQAKAGWQKNNDGQWIKIYQL